MARIAACVVYSLLLIGGMAPLRAEAQPTPTLKELYTGQRYFDLRDALRDRPPQDPVERLFYRGAVANKFGQINESLRLLEEYDRKAGRDADPELLAASLELRADGCLKTCQYRKAAETYREMLRRFRDTLGARESADVENSATLWGALADVPRQTVRITGDTDLKLEKPGYVPLKLNGREAALPVDTGANLSVASEAFAREHDMQIIETTIQVGAIAGNKVTARLGVARTLEIGKATIRNAVFLVFADKDLYIAEAHWQIEGLIGFPVVAALREVTFEGKNRLLIPAKPARGGEPNLCLDGLQPIVAGEAWGRRFAYAFDTGATHTTLYPPFFQAFEPEIKAKYQPRVERVRGVGEYRDVPGYLATDLTLRVGGREARFAQVPILTEATTDRSRHLYGNLGQDLIRQFARLTLNFEAMRLTFE